MSRLDANEVSGIVTELLGFRPEPTRIDDATNAVRERLKRRSLGSVADYAALLSDPTTRSVEARALADRLTINETYFFREDAHHTVLRDVVVPWHAARRPTPLRILSLGCSSGEEPYGLALTLDQCGFTRSEVRIVAIDASAEVITRAERARFSPWSMRNVDETTKRRYFTPSAGAFVLADEMRHWVRFHVANVVGPSGLELEPESFDVVFCRNVLIYFTPDVVRSVIDSIHKALRPGGFMFLGHAETGHAGPKFEPHEAKNAFYFTKRAARARETVRPGALAVALPRATFGLASAPESTAARSEPPSETCTALDTCFAAVRAERFDEALASLAGGLRSRESEIARAAILVNRGSVAEAREACSFVLELTGSDAEAHYLLGLCDELGKRADSARERYTRAAAIDGDFAMPLLRLGMLARRRGEHAAARRHLIDALGLFPYQTERVLLLFGGGFHVDGLARLCRTEMDACKTARS